MYIICKGVRRNRCVAGPRNCPASSCDFIAQVNERRIRFHVLGERVADGVRDDEEDQILVGETDFTLGGVHVHVKFHIGHVQEQDRDRLALGSVRFVSLLDGLGHHLAFDGTVADI